MRSTNQQTANIFCKDKKLAGTFFPRNVKCQCSELKSCITKKRNCGWDCIVCTVPTFSTVWSLYILRKFSFYVVNSFSNNSLCQSRTASVMSWPVALLAFFQNWGENLKKNPRKIFPAKHKPTAKIFCKEKKFAGVVTRTPTATRLAGRGFEPGPFFQPSPGSITTAFLMPGSFSTQTPGTNVIKIPR